MCDLSLLAYFFNGHIIFLLFYMDDIIIHNNYFLLQTLISKLGATFSLKQLGDLDYFFRIKLKHGPSNSFLLTHKPPSTEVVFVYLQLSSHTIRIVFLKVRYLKSLQVSCSFVTFICRIFH